VIGVVPSASERLLTTPAAGIAAASKLVPLLETLALDDQGLRAVEALLSAVNLSPHASVRAACARALGHLHWRADDPIGAPNLPVVDRIVVALCEALRRECVPKARVAIIQTLMCHAFIDYARVKPLLVHVAQNDSVTAVRSKARLALQYLEDF
jgi:hypothetical protein